MQGFQMFCTDAWVWYMRKAVSGRHRNGSIVAGAILEARDDPTRVSTSLNIVIMKSNSLLNGDGMEMWVQLIKRTSRPLFVDGPRTAHVGCYQVGSVGSVSGPHSLPVGYVFGNLVRNRLLSVTLVDVGFAGHVEAEQVGSGIRVVASNDVGDFLLVEGRKTAGVPHGAGESRDSFNGV